MKSFVEYICEIIKSLGIPFFLLLLGLFMNSSSWIPYALFSVLVSLSYFKNNKFGETPIALSFFSFSYLFAMAYNHDSQLSSIGFLICLMFAPSASYIFGYNSVKKLKYDKDLIILLILILISSLSLIAYVRTLISITETGNIINVSRSISMGSSNEATRSATLYGLIAAVGFTGIPIYCFCKDFRRKLYNILYILVGFLSLLITIHLLNRTGLVIIMVAILIILFLKSNSIPKLLLYLLVMIIFIYVLMDYINIDIINAYIARNEESGVADGGGRFGRWQDALLKIWQYPLGWKFDVHTYNEYCHNMWLDFARQAGWIPFIIFTILTLKSFRTLYKIIKIEKSSFTLLLVSLNVCIFLACSMEPVMEGCAFVLFFYCIVFGIQDAYYSKIKLARI